MCHDTIVICTLVCRKLTKVELFRRATKFYLVLNGQDLSLMQPSIGEAGAPPQGGAGFFKSGLAHF